jgi:hypothetical protein
LFFVFMKRDTFFGILILFGLLIAGIVYLSHIEFLNVESREVFFSDEDLPNNLGPTCPTGMKQCTVGGWPFRKRTCCRVGETCKDVFGSPLCSVNSKDKCPCGADGKPKKFCGGSKSNTCCETTSSCASNQGYAVCKAQDSGGNCPPGKTACGEFFCCAAHETCEDLGFGVKVCSARRDRECPDGQTLCPGVQWNICCPTGTCSGTGNGQDSPSCNVPACPQEPCESQGIDRDPNCDVPRNFPEEPEEIE